MQPGGYTRRFYRRWQNPCDLLPLEIRFRETDLHLFYHPVEGTAGEEEMARDARRAVACCYNQLDAVISRWPAFRDALSPPPPPGWIGGGELPLAEEMLDACSPAGVGPMSAVAGAVAEWVGRTLLARTPQVIVENGGDLFVATRRQRVMLVYAGEDSPFRDRVRVRLPASPAGLGVCTSSGKVGHSRSYGRTDAALVMARSAAVADAFATALGNMVQGEQDLEGAAAYARSREQLLGGIIIIGRRIALWGEVELV
ncbi:MAG: UPF0280 family protein [Spirochaetota bacterium]